MRGKEARERTKAAALRTDRSWEKTIDTSGLHDFPIVEEKTEVSLAKVSKVISESSKCWKDSSTG